MRRAKLIAPALAVLVLGVLAWRFLPAPWSDAGCISTIAEATPRAPVVLVYVLANVVGIGAPYLLIPTTMIAILLALRKRGDVIPGGTVIRFGTFIVGCGITHFTAALAVYYRNYWGVTYALLVTSAASWWTWIKLRGDDRRAIMALAPRADLEASLAREAALRAEAERLAEELRAVASERGKRAERLQGEKSELEAALATIERQRDDIRRMGTPIIQVWHRVLMVPLIGALDRDRAQDLMEMLLAAVGDHKARTVILDITGIELVDTEVAGHLLKIVSTIKLRGASAIVTGMQSAVAKTVSDMGVDLSKLTTLMTAEDAISTCLADELGGLRRGEPRRSAR